MRTLLLLFASCLVANMTAYGQTIRRVNNTAGMSAPYTTIDGAITAASTGDIILVEGSSTNYTLPNNYTLTKKVSIIGPGYSLTQNTGLQATTTSATIAMTGTFAIDAGAEGSVISGLVWTIPMEVRVSNITISHNGIFILNINNTTPQSNLWIHANVNNFNTFGVPVLASSGSAANNAYTNIAITNNLFNWRITLGPVKSGVFINNIIDIAPSSSCDLTNFQVSNNIFNNLSALTLTNAVVQNNVFCGTGYYTSFDPAFNNITNAVFANVFIGAGASPSIDGSYVLKAGSAAIGAGAGGTDAGIFGGPLPYTLSGIADRVPTVNALTVPGLIGQGSTLNVKVSAKSN